jgi:hypothetical protein
VSRIRAARRGEWPRVLIVLVALVFAAGARECRARARLRVELRTDTAADRGQLVPADTFAVVHLEPQRAVTVAVAPAANALETFKRAFDSPARPAASGAVNLTLPAAPPLSLVGVPLDIVLFADANRDGQWSDGEAYVTAWHGGRGGYRAVFVRNDGWNLAEGGEPPLYHSKPDRLVVFIDPVMRAVERQ